MSTVPATAGRRRSTTFRARPCPTAAPTIAPGRGVALVARHGAERAPQGHDRAYRFGAGSGDLAGVDPAQAPSDHAERPRVLLVQPRQAITQPPDHLLRREVGAQPPAVDAVAQTAQEPTHRHGRPIIRRQPGQHEHRVTVPPRSVGQQRSAACNHTSSPRARGPSAANSNRFGRRKRCEAVALMMELLRRPGRTGPKYRWARHGCGGRVRGPRSPAREGTMKQLSGLDASFLYVETGSQFGHVSSLSIYAKPEDDPDYDPFAAWRAQIERRLHLLEPLRRRLREVPLGLDHPYWIEDPDFDLDFHVRHSGVPPPGRDDQIAEIVARIVGRPLDRSRPLWETYVSRACLTVGSASSRRSTTPRSTAQRGPSCSCSCSMATPRVTRCHPSRRRRSRRSGSRATARCSSGRRRTSSTSRGEPCCWELAPCASSARRSATR